jgi:hypothetical protein
MIKLPLAIGLFSLLPLCAGAAPVSSSQAGSMTTLSGAAQGLAFGGFFSLYSFAVAGPCPALKRARPCSICHRKPSRRSATRLPKDWPTIWTPCPT